MAGRIERDMLGPTFGALNSPLKPAQKSITESELQNVTPRVMVYSTRDLSHMKNKNVVQKKLHASLKSQSADDPSDDNLEENEKRVANAERLDIQPVSPNRDADFYMDKNPLYCGAIILAQKAFTEEAEHAAVVCGGDVPSTPEEMRARMLHRVGVEGNAERVRFGLKTALKRDIPLSRTSTLLIQLFRTKDQPPHRIMYQIQEHVELKQQPTKKCETNSKVQATDKAAATSLALPVQRRSTLHLQDMIRAALSEMEIPCLGLTRTCNYLLRDVRNRMLASRWNPPLRRNRNDTQDETLLGMVGDILHENFGEIEEKRGKVGMWLQLAAVEYRRMWQWMDSDAFRKNRPVCFSAGGAELYGDWTPDKTYEHGW
ncbi:hypothetical protein G6011_10663 [Alternaria panax]|uniref:Uncharacterized protein n=1 Tax=Alternaria panax TaxID=48097 RepID=A0AAD4ICA4_9PLEO|nr:hypothetical protein G6011_10663 [Alternaria panax]